MTREGGRRGSDEETGTKKDLTGGGGRRGGDEKTGTEKGVTVGKRGGGDANTEECTREGGGVVRDEWIRGGWG